MCFTLIRVVANNTHIRCLNHYYKNNRYLVYRHLIYRGLLGLCHFIISLISLLIIVSKESNNVLDDFNLVLYGDMTGEWSMKFVNIA